MTRQQKAETTISTHVDLLAVNTDDWKEITI